MSNVEFRDLLLYCGHQLREKDIPQRAAIGRHIVNAFKNCYQDLISELAVRSVCSFPLSIEPYNSFTYKSSVGIWEGLVHQRYVDESLTNGFHGGDSSLHHTSGWPS